MRTYDSWYIVRKRDRKKKKKKKKEGSRMDRRRERESQPAQRTFQKDFSPFPF